MISSKAIASLSLLSLILLTSSSAFALDGYQDRHGIFAGVAVGGGVGLVESEQGLTGLDTGRKAGMNLSAQVGSGISQHLTFAGEANLWSRTTIIGSSRLDSRHSSFMALASFFLIEGFYLEGGGGLAYASYDAQQSGMTQNYRELGFAIKGGAGFEYFVNSNVALGMRVGYTRHFYNNADFDTIAGGLTLRWY